VLNISSWASFLSKNKEELHPELDEHAKSIQILEKTNAQLKADFESKHYNKLDDFFFFINY